MRVWRCTAAGSFIPGYVEPFTDVVHSAVPLITKDRAKVLGCAIWVVAGIASFTVSMYIGAWIAKPFDASAWYYVVAIVTVVGANLLIYPLFFFPLYGIFLLIQRRVDARVEELSFPPQPEVPSSSEETAADDGPATEEERGENSGGLA